MTTPYRTAKRSLPMLASVQVASPCSAEWSDMVGDDRVRFCGSCAKNVYNLSAMLAEDAERLLVERAGKDLCVRFFQRADGTMMTSDCPVGVTRKRRKKVAMAVAGAGAMAFGAFASLRESARQGGYIPAPTGEVAATGPPPAAPEVPTAMGTVAPPTAPPVAMMGDIQPVEVKGEPSLAQGGIAPAPAVRPLMGRMPARRDGNR